MLKLLYQVIEVLQSSRESFDHLHIKGYLEILGRFELEAERELRLAFVLVERYRSKLLRGTFDWVCLFINEGMRCRQRAPA